MQGKAYLVASEPYVGRAYLIEEELELETDEFGEETCLEGGDEPDCATSRELGDVLLLGFSEARLIFGFMILISKGGLEVTFFGMLVFYLKRVG